MINKAEIIRNADSIIKKRKESAEFEAKSKFDNLFFSNKELETLVRKQDEIRKKIISVATSSSNPENMIELKDEFFENQSSIENVLKNTGYSMDDFAPKYQCEICNDEGKINGARCSCFKTLYRQMVYKQLCSEMPIDEYNFESFSLDFYQGDKNKSIMKSIFSKCQTYSENFSEKSGNIILSGRTGLGKTHLALSIANAVGNKGYSVFYNSVQNIFSKIEKEHFKENSDELLDYVLNCDLLILDDLGTEFLSAYTSSVLYTVINTRILNNKPIIISTNLGTEELDEKYGERIFSRFIGNFDFFTFVGQDIRIKKKIENKN